MPADMICQALTGPPPLLCQCMVMAGRSDLVALGIRQQQLHDVAANKIDRDVQGRRRWATGPPAQTRARYATLTSTVRPNTRAAASIWSNLDA